MPKFCLINEDSEYTHVLSTARSNLPFLSSKFQHIFTQDMNFSKHSDIIQLSKYLRIKNTFLLFHITTSRICTINLQCSVASFSQSASVIV